MKKIVGIFIITLGLTSALYAQDNPGQKSMEFLSQFEGSWKCEGAYVKNDKPIEATVTFAPIREEKAIKFEKIIYPPNDFHAMGLWSVDAPSKTITNLAVYTNSGKQRALSNFFVGNIKGESTMTFTADTLAAPPFTRHRYLYQIKAEDQYRVEWQVFHKEKWRSVDYLNCQQVL